MSADEGAAAKIFTPIKAFSHTPARCIGGRDKLSGCGVVSALGLRRAEQRRPNRRVLPKVSCHPGHCAGRCWGCLDCLAAWSKDGAKTAPPKTCMKAFSGSPWHRQPACLLLPITTEPRRNTSEYISLQ